MLARLVFGLSRAISPGAGPLICQILQPKATFFSRSEFEIVELEMG
jgi:hypothetical protein